MSRMFNCKRVMAIFLSLAIVLAFMPMLGGANSANASVKKIEVKKMSFIRDESNGPVHYYVYESEEDEWENWEPDFCPDDYITYNGTDYWYDYDNSDTTQRGHWDFLNDEDEPIGDWYIKKKREYDNGKYEYSFKIVLEDDYNTIAETEYYPVQMEYDWDVHVEIDGKRKGLDKDNNEANVDVDNNEDCKLKVTPYFVQGFDKNLFHYKWKMSEWSLDDYGDLDAVQQNDLNAGDINEISVDTRNLEAGKRYRYRCYVGYDEAADENCYYVDILLYIRTDDEMAADKVSKMINGIDAYHMTLADEASVKAARAAYELLTEAQKKELGSFDEDYLLYLEKRIKEIKNAAAAAKAKNAKIKAAQTASVGKLKAKSLKKKVQLTWSKANGVSGYEVYQSNKKSGKYKKVATLKASVTKWKSKKIKKGKKAFFKVRPFTNIGGKNFFGKFAATSVKLKK